MTRFACEQEPATQVEKVKGAKKRHPAHEAPPAHRTEQVRRECRSSCKGSDKRPAAAKKLRRWIQDSREEVRQGNDACNPTCHHDDDHQCARSALFRPRK